MNACTPNESTSSYEVFNQAPFPLIAGAPPERDHGHHLLADAGCPFPRELRPAAGRHLCCGPHPRAELAGDHLPQVRRATGAVQAAGRQVLPGRSVRYCGHSSGGAVLCAGGEGAAVGAYAARRSSSTVVTCITVAEILFLQDIIILVTFNLYYSGSNCFQWLCQVTLHDLWGLKCGYFHKPLSFDGVVFSCNKEML
jgi:hypothetical protein